MIAVDVKASSSARPPSRRDGPRPRPRERGTPSAGETPDPSTACSEAPTPPRRLERQPTSSSSLARWGGPARVPSARRGSGGGPGGGREALADGPAALFADWWRWRSWGFTWVRCGDRMRSMTCRQGGTENRPGRRFCAECGTPMAAQCSACGAANEPADKFCGDCGVPLSGDPAATGSVSASHVSERRLVSVLFADLVGFTTLSEHRDPEEVRELLGSYVAGPGIDRAPRWHGREVHRRRRDGCVGEHRSSREDDAERAVRAAPRP